MASTSDPSAWRIDRQKWSRSSFDGAGAALEGGRWNSAGVPVIYCSRNLAMAAQEKYVHLPKPIMIKLLKFRLDFASVAIERLRSLPAGCREFPAGPATQRIGDEWARSARTAILEVPSVLIPEEINYLLNPLHPHFIKIVISPPEPFAFDGRVGRLQEPSTRWASKPN